MSIAERIEHWFATQVCNSPASRDVEIINHLRGAVDRLKADLDPASERTDTPAAGGADEEEE